MRTIKTATAALGALLGSTACAGDWRGVDLSYVNELEDCGAVFHDREGNVADPFEIFADNGANIVRLRLWHGPAWTDYSTFEDVKVSIRRAKAAGMEVLLDFHYSDDWADPGDQIVPAAWADLESVEDLANALYTYTYGVLDALAADDLLPEYVQVGNETNTSLAVHEKVEEEAPIDWRRDSILYRAGLKAVRRVAEKHETSIGTMLHIAQPEYVTPWFDDAIANGVVDFDIIGMSYYPKWSKTPFKDLGGQIETMKAHFGRDIVVVETAYPWTLDGVDEAGNILGEDSLIEGYPATPDGQRRYLLDLMANVTDAGGLGVVYWEPAWISSSCETRWGKGSHWENATLFDFEGPSLHQGADYLKAD